MVTLTEKGKRKGFVIGKGSAKGAVFQRHKTTRVPQVLLVKEAEKRGIVKTTKVIKTVAKIKRQTNSLGLFR